MCDRVDGCPDEMRAFLQLQRERPDLATVPRAAPGGTCVGGMASCAELSVVDNEATGRLVRFLTHMTQGIDAYVALVSRAARTYEDGAALSATRIADVCDNQAPGLPDVAPELAAPRGA